jgi:filamentous hemagglutinin family protein
MQRPAICQNRTSRRQGPGRALLLATTALTSSLMVSQALAQTLPTGGSVAAGSVSIAAPTPTQLNVTQTSQSAVVNWQGFSVGQGAAVSIQQPNATSAMLNRVTGDTPSTIAGSLTANGQVYLVNPNGIAITGTGIVNAGGGFVASTLGISDADFLSGKRTFTGSGASAAVSNAGTITVGRGGYAALIGGSVSNSGSIFVPLGKIGLGSGERATLDFSGDGFLQVALPTTAGGTGALVSNGGTIKADGGNVIISAATAREAARNAVNISGVIQARSIGGRSGSILIGGGAGGGVNISGRLVATSRHGTGGTIAVTGQSISLEGATIDASGKTGGGTINIGGGRQGQGPLQQADTLSVDGQTTIRADASAAGNGGAVVLWSNQLTHFVGTISARGGAIAGNGGEAEVSGKAKLDYTGFTDLSAVNGSFGTLLLDPYNVTISNGASTGGFDATASDSVINATTLMTALGAANVTITTGTGGTQAGNITVASPLTWSAPTTLAMNAAGAIAINAPITIMGGGGLDLTATAQAGISTTGLTFGNGASIDYGATDNGGTFKLNGTSYKLVYSMVDLDAIDGLSAVNNASTASYGTGLAGSYALATNLNTTGTTYATALIGTNGSGNAATQFSGQLDGLGHTVTGLTISAPGSQYVGLVGYVNGAQASISNIGLVGGSVTGASNVGSLLGYLALGTVQGSSSGAAVTGTLLTTGGLIGGSDGTVQSSYATGAVAGVNSTGGLIGRSNGTGTVTSSYATGAVTGAGSTGGLVGLNYGAATGSYATGAVTGTAIGAVAANGTGGLVGTQQTTGSVTASYATGAIVGGLNVGGLVGVSSLGTSVLASYATGTVSGVQNVGGLLGQTTASVQSSYATGAVKATGPKVGGLAGQNNWTIQASYATGAVTGAGNNVGGLVGQNTLDRGIISSSFATGAVSGTGANIGGLIGNNLGAVSSSYSTGVVAGTGSVRGGLIGLNTGTVTSSYWDMLTSGMTASAAGTGLATAGLQGALQAGFDSMIWSTGAGLYPYLKWQFVAGSTPQAVSGFATQANGAALTGATIAGTINGAALTATGTGANGYYYILVPQGSTSVGSGVFVDIAGNAVKSNAYVSGAASSTQNLDLNAGMLTVRTGTSTMSSLAASLASVVGVTPTGDLVFSTPGGVLTANSGAGVSIAASGAFTIDQTLTVANAVRLIAAGSLTIAATGSVSSSNGNATLAGSRFVNLRGADAISTANGRWLVYSADPTNDTRGGLAYTFKQYAAIYGVTPVAQATGNGFLYSVAPTATATASKTYDGTNGAALATTAAGLDGDVIGLGYTSAAYGDANAGTGKTVTVDGLTMTSATNGGSTVYGYTLGAATGTILARAIIVTADAQTRTYGNANPALSFTVGGSGLVNGDTLSGALATAATSTTGVGSYGITQGSLANSNYALTYAAANLTITQRAITVSANAQSRAYGDANPALGYTVSAGNLVNGDSLSGSLSTSATAASNVGNYSIAQGTLGNSNYALSYAAASMTITARPITVSANAQSRAYGDVNPALTYTVGGSGLVNGDSLLGSLANAATVVSGVGSYGIGQNTLAASSNYAMTYTAANLVITTRALTVTTDAQSRIYGDANPALTYTVGGSGLVNGDGLTGSLTTGATIATGVGSYGITQGSVAASSNYALTYAAANLAITARPITVTADAQSRIFGDANPALTYTVGGQGLVNGDALGGSLATDATPGSAAGAYAIAAGTIATLNPNYAIGYAGANLVVRAVAVAPASPATPAAAEPAPATTTSTIAASTFVAATPDAIGSRQTTISFQSAPSGTTVITPLTSTSTATGSGSGSTTRSATRQSNDNDIVTGSVAPQAKRKKKPRAP